MPYIGSDVSHFRWLTPQIGFFPRIRQLNFLLPIVILGMTILCHLQGEKSLKYTRLVLYCQNKQKNAKKKRFFHPFLFHLLYVLFS